jgi:hypothetical protein
MTIGYGNPSFGYSGGASSVPPIPPIASLTPEQAIQSLLTERQEYPIALPPLGGLILGDALVERISGTSLIASNGAVFNVSPLDQRLNVQSPLAGGLFYLPNTNSRIDAVDPSIFQIGTESALVVLAARYPDTPSGIAFAISTRDNQGTPIGWEVGLQANDGRLIATGRTPTDGPMTTAPLFYDETRTEPGGRWHIEVLYRDKISQTIQLGNETEFSPRETLSGNLTSQRPVSFGAGRSGTLAIQNAQIALAAFWRGPQLDGLFADTANGYEQLTAGPTIWGNVALPLYAHLAGVHLVESPQ